MTTRAATTKSAHSIWSGSISFGLVNIPVKIYTATENNDFSFKQLDDKGHKIQHKKWCPVEDKEIPYSELKKGYPISKNSYVVVEKEDLEKIKLKTTDTIDIKEFIKAEDFDPIFVEKSYYIAPASTKKKNSNSNNNTTTTSSLPSKAYSLFVNALNETKRIAIGKVVLREKEHLVALRAYQRGLVMHQLKYLDEIKPMEQVGELSSSSPPSSSINSSQQATTKVDSKELSLGKSLVENLTSEDFDPSQYSDTYAKELEKLIQAKSKGQEGIKQITTEGKEGEDTKDLLEALKASLKTTSSNKSSSRKVK
jgi:DNA end-binding protein Ku